MGFGLFAIPVKKIDGWEKDKDEDDEKTIEEQDARWSIEVKQK